MKKILPVLIFIISSCSKEVIQQQTEHKFQFTASVFLTPSANAVSYDLFVTNAPLNRNDSFMIYAGRFKGNSYSFDFKEYKCKEFTVTPNQRLYGAVRIVHSLNEFGKLIYNSVTIK